MQANSDNGGGEAVPVHVAVIMDGNGRWAKARSLPRVAGHRKGAEAVRRTVEAARALGIAYITLFSFSSENWSRPDGEVSELMSLLRFYLRSEIAELNKQGVRLRVIGDRARLSDDINQLITNAETVTATNSALTLVIALSYGSRQEIVQTVRRLVNQVKAGDLRAEDIDERLISSSLLTAGIPDPDLVIRTSGEKRLSNFLLWQSAYAELVFIDTLWPDFTRQDLEAAIKEYHRRERRYGASVGKF
ncbi:MAG: isoprenyl transferase [Rhodospirillaceae bacterium]